MGKRINKSFKAVSKYAFSERKSFRQLLMSVISLVLACFVLATATFSWFSIKTSRLEANNFRLDCGKGLRVNDSGKSELSFNQNLNKYLIPASSVDGRNLFFPADGSDFSKITNKITYRSANAGDKNKNYIQIDFTLTAQQNHTALYINDKKTSIKVKKDGESEFTTARAGALRSALWCSTEEQGVPNTPIVFNASPATVRTTAVADVDRATGAYISGGPQVAHAFNEYAFGGSPVATLKKGVQTKFSYIIWLEGTDQKCSDRVLNEDIQIELAFTTSWDKTQYIRFKDDTSNTWIKNKLTDTQNKYTLMLRYSEVDSNNVETGAFTDFNMYKYIDNDDTEWVCNIPGDMRKNISFILRPPGGNGTEYVFRVNSKTQSTDISGDSAFTSLTDDKKTLDRKSNRRYVVDVLANTEAPAYCRGYWQAIGDSDGTGHDTIGDLDGDDF